MLTMAVVALFVASTLFLIAADDVQTVVTGGVALLAFAVAMASYMSGPDWGKLTRDVAAVRQAVERLADPPTARASTVRDRAIPSGRPCRWFWPIGFALIALACLRRK